MADKDITRGDLGFIERWKDWTGHFAKFSTAILTNSSGTEVGTATTPLHINLTGATPTLTVPVQITKTVVAVATPEALAADGTFFQTATLIGKKAARTNNTGTVYLGIGATNDTQPLEIAPGEMFAVEAPDGQKYDLNDFYLDVGTAGDGVIIIYS